MSFQGLKEMRKFSNKLVTCFSDMVEGGPSQAAFKRELYKLSSEIDLFQIDLQIQNYNKAIFNTLVIWRLSRPQGLAFLGLCTGKAI